MKPILIALLATLLITGCLETETFELPEPLLQLETVTLAVDRFETLNRASGFTDIRLVLDNGYGNLTPEQRALVTNVTVGTPRGEVDIRPDMTTFLAQSYPVGERACFRLSFKTLRGNTTPPTEFCYDVP